MMEIDLPRMESLSPHLDLPSGMTILPADLPPAPPSVVHNSKCCCKIIDTVCIAQLLCVL